MIQMSEEKKSFFKENVANIASVGSMVAMVIGGWLFFDERYAHAQSVQRMATEQAQQIQQLTIQNSKNFKRLELNSIDDKIFYLEMKNPRSQVEEALLNRYKQQRRDLEREIREESRPR